MYYRLYFLFVVFLVLPFLAISQSSGATKNVGAYGIQIGFSHDRSKISSTDVASNVLFIINNVNKTMELNLELSSPAGWKLFSKRSRKISIAANDTMYIPVRVRPAYNIEGNTNYILNAFISTDEFTLANAMWYIEVKKISAWSAYTPTRKLYLTENKDSSSFSVVISNNGNSDEALRLSITPDRELMLIGSNGESILNYPSSIYLRAGQDTVIHYSLKLKSDINRPEDNNFNKKESQRSFNVKLKIINEKTGKGSNKTWSGNIDFYKVANSKKVKETKFDALPITVELNAYDALSHNTYTNLSIYGNKVFENNSTLNYYFQADFVQNQLRPESFMGNYQYIGYFHKHFTLEAGDIGTSRLGSSLSGKGIKGSVTFFKNTLGVLYIQKPSLFDGYYASGYGFSHTLKTNKLFWDNYYQYESNDMDRLVKNVGTSFLNFRIFKGHTLNIGGGYSVESHNWDPANIVTVTGYEARLGFSGGVRKLSYRFSTIYSTPSYSLRRGAKTASGGLRYKINRNYNINAQYSYSDLKPILYFKGVIVDSTTYNNVQTMNINFNYVKGKGFYSFVPKYTMLKNNYIDVNTAGMEFSYRLRSKSAFKFYSTVYGGYNRFLRNPELGDVFAAMIRASIRYKTIQASIRYHYGPYYQIDQLQYVINQENPQKLYANINHDYWFLNSNMRLITNMSYNINTINLRQQFFIRPELFYYAKNGFRFSTYARYMVFGEGEYLRTHHTSQGDIEEIVPSMAIDRFEVGAGVKFNINAPISFKKNLDVRIIAFRDLNGNGKKDVNETGIGDMLIHLKLNDTITNDFTQNTSFTSRAADELDLVTNRKGEAEYLNLPMGDYSLTAQPLASMGGWFDGKTFYHTIDRDKTIYLPLSRGARVSGGILVETDKYGTGKKEPLGNIRVTAIKQDNGKTYSTLTSADGHFVMFVPNGDYVIVINEAAVSSHYSFIQNNIPLTINEDFENYNVSFYLSEKKRNINVRGKRTRYIPIQRTQHSTNKKVEAPKSDSLIEQKTQLDDPKYLPVVEPNEQGEVWVVQLYANEEARKLVTEFDTLKDISSVRCITGSGGGFLYISDSLAKKKLAKKLLKKIKKAGFKNAKVVSMVFGNRVEDEPVEEGINKKFKKIKSDSDREYFRIEIKKSPKKLTSEDFMALIPDIKVIYVIQQNGLYKYSLGEFDTIEEANTYKEELLNAYSIPDASVTQYKEDL
ncbi:MAG: hypothetical protein B6I18_05140 [Bacteroidetes bacterium 4572_112]|nr:MAG: hypothetical protein B6I18_05140 [Bacteroidetes bacterium 4572_112]